MRIPAMNAALVLPLLLTGCIHFPFQKTQQAQVTPQKTAPRIQEAPPNPMQPPTEPLPPVVSVPKPVVTQDVGEQKPKKKPSVKKSKDAEKPAEQTASDSSGAPGASTDLASSGTPAVSAMGQLSVGEPSDLYRQTSGSIANLERSLNGITRKLNDGEQKTAAHIREFLKQAKVALAAGDLDGASTLTAKAKVLLAELNE